MAKLVLLHPLGCSKLRIKFLLKLFCSQNHDHIDYAFCKFSGLRSVDKRLAHSHKS